MTSPPTVHPAIAGHAPWQRAVLAFIEAARAQYGERLTAVVLYGSRARGDADEQESDVDLLVVLRGEFDYRSEQQKIENLSYDVRDHDEFVLLSAMIAAEADYRKRMLPLFMNIRREGVVLWPISPAGTRVGEDRPEYDDAQRADLALVLAAAHEALTEARVGLEQGFSGWAVNRAYYTMFHAATALLLSEGLAFSRHSGVISAVRERYVKTGRLPHELGSALDAALAARNKADYAYRERIDDEDARHLVDDATEFLAAAEGLIAPDDRSSKHRS
jgi:uncharacterized protein (UPF0332 family)/predicted nucleotidyltransferase